MLDFNKRFEAETWLREQEISYDLDYVKDSRMGTFEAIEDHDSIMIQQGYDDFYYPVFTFTNDSDMVMFKLVFYEYTNVKPLKIDTPMWVYECCIRYENNEQ